MVYVILKKDGIIFISMKIAHNASTSKQIAYARASFGAEGKRKKDIALAVGYSESIANSVVGKIETHKGYINAMGELAKEGNNLALSIFDEFKRRDMSDFSNKELIVALGTIATALDKFNQRLMEAANPKGEGKNRLRTLVLQNIKKQVNEISDKDIEEGPEEDDGAF